MNNASQKLNETGEFLHRTDKGTYTYEPVTIWEDDTTIISATKKETVNNICLDTLNEERWNEDIEPIVEICEDKLQGFVNEIVTHCETKFCMHPVHELRMRIQQGIVYFLEHGDDVVDWVDQFSINDKSDHPA